MAVRAERSSTLVVLLALLAGCRATPPASTPQPDPAAVSRPSAPATPEGERVVRFIEFLAGTPLTPAERATVLQEDASDRQRIPAQIAQGDRIIAALLGRADAANTTQRAALRQSEMNQIFSQGTPREDPQSMAIVQAHNRVLAASPAAHLVLTEGSVNGILDEIAVMGEYGGRAPVSEAERQSFAQQLPAVFQQADGKRQGYMAFAASDALALRGVLHGFTAADRARYQQTVAGTTATPLLLEQAAENTLLKHNAAVQAARGVNAAGLRASEQSIQLGYKIGLSPLLPH